MCVEIPFNKESSPDEIGKDSIVLPYLGKTRADDLYSVCMQKPFAWTVQIALHKAHI